MEAQRTCIFCNYLNSENCLVENELVFAIYDNFPGSKGHVLIIPKRHFVAYFDATKEEIHAFYSLTTKIKKFLDDEHKPDGYNIGINIGEAAGQTIFHLHIHIIPRYIGDVENPRDDIRKLKRPLVEYYG